MTAWWLVILSCQRGQQTNSPRAPISRAASCSARLGLIGDDEVAGVHHLHPAIDLEDAGPAGREVPGGYLAGVHMAGQAERAERDDARAGRAVAGPGQVE